MNAQVEEAVLHESERILKWGWFGGRRGFYETWPRCRSRTWARGGHVPNFTPLTIMPKIRTTRTKKAPEGFEEIEPVGMLYCFQCNPR
jgi:hypothetical protein